MTIRGRVLAIDGDVAVIRGERVDARVTADPTWRPGDLVERDRSLTRCVRAYDGPPYPGPGTEVARLPRHRLALLQARARALAALRGFFAARGFLEVETPLLVPSPASRFTSTRSRPGRGT